MFGRKDDWYERSEFDGSSDLDKSVAVDCDSKGFDIMLICKIFGFLIIFGSIISFCYLYYKSVNVKVLDVQKSVVPVQIYDEYQRDVYISHFSTGSSLVPVIHDAVFKITFDYDGMKFVVDDEQLYAKYCDNLGRFVDAVLEISAMSDGTVRYQIVELEPHFKGGDSIE